MKHTIILLTICISVQSGCLSTTVIDKYIDAEISLKSGDSVVLLGRRYNSEHEIENDFISCVGKALSRGETGINIIPEDLFLDSMYPHFEVSTAPVDVKNLGKLVQDPVIAKKFSEFSIRYFIWIDGYTERVDSSGSFSCAVGPGGAGCFGFTTWKDEASYEASVWDFDTLNLAGRISAETQGTSYMPMIYVPIPLLARVQANACSSMASQIKGFME